MVYTNPLYLVMTKEEIRESYRVALLMPRGSVGPWANKSLVNYFFMPVMRTLPSTDTTTPTCFNAAEPDLY